MQDHVGRTLEHDFRIGLRVLLGGFGVMGGWAILVPLSVAVVAPANLVVESNVKKVQHPTGGIVASILVRDGQRVAEGDTVIRLDETQARTNVQVLTKQLNQIRARMARLSAERDGSEKLKPAEGPAGPHR